MAKITEFDADESVIRIIEKACEEICEKYCKYPDIWKAEEHDGIELIESEVCNNCPMNRLI